MSLTRHERFCWLVQLESQDIEHALRYGIVGEVVATAMRLDPTTIPDDLYEAAREFVQYQYGYQDAKRPEWIMFEKEYVG